MVGGIGKCAFGNGSVYAGVEGWILAQIEVDVIDATDVTGLKRDGGA